MAPLEVLLARLRGVRRAGAGWLAGCPVHAGAGESLSLTQGPDGQTFLTCQAGCEPSAILNAVGLTEADLFPGQHDSFGPRQQGAPCDVRDWPTSEEAVAELEKKFGPRSAQWTYHDARGEAVGVVVRCHRGDRKSVGFVFKVKDAWRIGAVPQPRPLYGLPDLAEAQRVVVCEGEKAADAARKLGFVATTSAGGSQAAEATDWGPLRGKEVWVLSDNDAPGRSYAECVAALCRAAGAAGIRILDLADHAPTLPEGGDLAAVVEDESWCGLPLADGAGPADLKAYIERLAQQAPPWRAEAGEDLTFRPFPVEALPEPVRGFVMAGARAIGCDPCYLALPLLVFLGAAIGQSRSLRLKRKWLAPPILWAAAVANSGTAKTPGLDCVTEPFMERERKAFERYEEEMKRHEADVARWEKDMADWRRNGAGAGDPPRKPEPPRAERFVVADTTVEALAPLFKANPRGLTLLRDELAAWLSFDRYGNGRAGGDAANYLSMHRGGPIIVDRKSHGPIFVPRAPLSVYGGIQPGTLMRTLGAEHRESGLAARLLLAWPPPMPKRWTESDIEPAQEAALARLVDRLYELQPTTDEDGRPRPALVTLSPEARAVFVAYYNAHNEEQAGLADDLASAWSKLEEYAARLALVVHCIRLAANDPTLSEQDHVDAASMNAAIAITAWFKREARRVYAMLDESDDDRESRRLEEWIARKGEPVTPRQVQQGYRPLRAPGAAEPALEDLVKRGRGFWEPSPAGQRGQPTRRFRLYADTPVNGNGVSQAENRITVGVDSVDTAEPPEADGPGANACGDPGENGTAPQVPSNGHRAGLFGGSPAVGPYCDRA